MNTLGFLRCIILKNGRVCECMDHYFRTHYEKKVCQVCPFVSGFVNDKSIFKGSGQCYIHFDITYVKNNFCYLRELFRKKTWAVVCNANNFQVFVFVFHFFSSLSVTLLHNIM